MPSKISLTHTLHNSVSQAEKVFNSILKSDSKDKIDDLYEKLKESKGPFYGDALFRDASEMIGELNKGETISDEEKVKIEQQVAQIHLAVFAYNIFRTNEYKINEYKTCTQAFFQRIVSPFNKYTKNEIQLFLSLHLYLLRQEMNANDVIPNSNVSNKDLIEKQFPKEPSAYHFGDIESSDKKAGKDQIMKAVDITLNFLCSKVSALTFDIRFGSTLIVNKFLNDFITYRLDEHFSCEPDREVEEGFPETEDELKALVEEIFNDDFISEVEAGETENINSQDEGYSLEDNEDSEGSKENDLEDGSSDSEFDESTTNSSSSSENNDTHVPTELSADENDEEDELRDEEEEGEEEVQQAAAQTTRQIRASATRRRITDEQPGARSVTAEEAGFSDDASTRPTRRSPNPSTSNNNTSGSPRRQQVSHSSVYDSRKRKAPENRDRSSSVSDDNEQEATPPPKFHICDDGRARPIPALPKTREKPRRWSPEQVRALEEGLRFFKKRAWRQIKEMFKDKLGSFGTTQMKDKAVNEIKRRQKLGISLEGFEFVNNQEE